MSFENQNPKNQGVIIAITNKASGGTIGTAATTIDVADTININQTTASQTLTVADMTNASAYKKVVVNNVGSQSFTFTGTGLSTTIPAGHGILMQWSGAAYSLIDGGGGSSTTPASVAATGAITSNSATAGIGYATGSGGTVSQATSRTTGVTLNKVVGEITMFTAAGSATAASFTVTNSAMAATDNVILNVKSATNKYMLFVTAKAAGSFEITFLTTGGTTSDSPVISFEILKGVAA